MFTVPEGATLRSSTAVGTQLRLSLPSRSQTIANWEKEITECALEQSSNKKLVDQIIPWVAAGHLDKIQGALKNVRVIDRLRHLLVEILSRNL